jgi:GT2 family glycosyltransferase
VSVAESVRERATGTESQITVGVIVPVWNGRRLLPDTLASLLAQRRPGNVRLHAVLVDDGSHDGSATWCRRLAEQWHVPEVRLTVEALAANGGRAAARNRGVEIALEIGCSHLTFLDQDDLLPCDSVAARLSWLRESGAAMVHGRQSFFVVPGATRPSWCRPEWLSEPQAGNVLGAILMRREVWHEVGPFDPNLRHGGDDAEWFMRARRSSVIVDRRDPTVLVRRVHAANGSGDVRSRGELAEIVRRHLAARRAGS